MTRALAGIALGLLAAGCEPAAEHCGGAGVVCTIAGTGEPGYGGELGPAIEARLALPQDTLAAPSGDLYILDWNNHRVRKLTSDGTIELVAGTGDLLPVHNLVHPTALVLQPDEETLLVASWHDSLVHALELGSPRFVDTYGDGQRAYRGDGGPASDASFDLPASLALDPDGNLIILDQANQVIRRIDERGVIDRIAGQCVVEPLEGGCGDAPLVQCPGSDKLSCDTSLCDRPCSPGFSPNGGDALALRMHQPFGAQAEPGGRLAYDDQGNLHVADPGNHVIRRIDPDGRVTTIAGTPPVDGVPQRGHAGDGGPATAALLDNPVDLAFGEGGTLYFTDVRNHCVRAIDPAGTITTVAGVCGERGYEGDGGPATEALFNLPFGLEHADGTLYIADTGNNVIRSVELP